MESKQQPPMMEPPPPYSVNGQYPPQGHPQPPPPPGFAPYQTQPGGYMPQAPPVTVSTTRTVVIQQGFGPYPMQVTCGNCNATVMTETNASPGLLTWLLSGTLLLVGCWLGCCLIPCCIPECQDIEHRCPNCKVHVGTYRRL